MLLNGDAMNKKMEGNIDNYSPILLIGQPSFSELLVNNNYKQLRDSLYLTALIIVESGNNPDTHNVKENAKGILQIRPIMVKECNRLKKKEKYTHNDCYNVNKSIEMYWIIQNKHNPNFDLFTASAIWNGGHRPNRLNNNVLTKVEKYHNKIIKKMKEIYEEN